MCLDSLRKWFSTLFAKVEPETPLDRELRRVEAAVRRYQAELDRMSAHWYAVDGTCCPMCMFGNEWTYWEMKHHRTSEWLKHLQRKKKKNDSNQSK